MMSFERQIIGGAALLLAMAIALYRRMVPDKLQQSIKASNTPNDRTVEAIKDLALALPDQVFLRDHANLYSSVRSYWSTQAQELIPACVIQPTTPQDVSTAMKILSKHIVQKVDNVEKPLQFAVRSGGHNPTKGYANVQDGIVIDLKHFSSVTLSEDQSHIDIGPAARWIDVYSKLDPLGLSVAGGRASTVGVGGLLLGGGLSFHSPQVGFACDNVTSFEVVLADGRIVTANSQSNPDLAVALRGGGNNFGIVTKFTMSVLQQPKIFAGYFFYYAKEKDRLLQAFYDFCNPKTYDKHSNCLMSFGYAMGQVFHVGTLQYMKPDKRPKALEKLTTLKHFWTTAKICTMSDATSQVNSFTPGDQRWLWHTTTFENNLEMLHYCYDNYKNTLGGVKSVKGLGWSLVFQPLTPFATAKSHLNAMGVKTDKTLTIVQVSVSWKRSEDDAAVISTTEELIGRIESEAKRRGVHNPYKYVNYSSASQNPYDGYGADKRQLLRTASAKYDPEQVFQKGVIGCFKL